MAITNFEVRGKRLLVLGGTSAKDIVLQAKRMGIYTIVADFNETNAAKQVADESVRISTADTDALVKFIKETNIDGVFSGPSEFNIQQVMKVCEAAGLPFYATKEQWDICQNKASFKALCHKFNVPVVPEYEITEEMRPEDLAKIKYPVVVKPTDSYSSKGLSICKNEKELKIAIPFALSFSPSKHFIVEKCITSDYGFGCRYIANDGKIYLSAVNDQYTVDKFDGLAHISAVSCFPSKKTDIFIKEINPNVISMFESIGLSNGTFFMQALVDQDTDQIYFHEMGLRLSGGLNYKLFERACGYNDVQMMIRYALGGPMATAKDIDNINPQMNGHIAGSITIPLKVGIIAKIEGIETLQSCKQVVGINQYYIVGDEIKENFIGTLSQHFCRVKLLTNSMEEFRRMIDFIYQTIKVIGSKNEDMIYRRFDLSRLK